MAKKKDTEVNREMLTARLSPEAAAGWRDFCKRNGISLTAFMEIAGLDLADDVAPSKIGPRREMVEKARAIDMDRRDRRPDR